MHRTALALIAALPLAAALTAQDLRDRVELEGGREVRGRVVTPFATDEVLVMQGGKRVRIRRDRIKAIETITADVATFLDERKDAADDADRHWALAEWALTEELGALARIQALTTVLIDPDHAEAHELLGHRQHPKRGWLWPIRSSWGTFEKAEEHHSKWGRALELESEHFAIRTDAGYRTAVDALVDLERLYVFVLGEYGEALQLREAIVPMTLAVYREEEAFPARSRDAIPYYEPLPFTDTGWTFLRVTETRPVELFSIGTQMMLYRCLAADAGVSDRQARFCPWAELGFAAFVQSRMRGEPGLAEAGSPQIDAGQLDLARNGRDYRIPNLIHLTLRDHFYGNFRPGPNVHWFSVHAFVQFLMDPGVDPGRPGQFLEYLRLAVAEAKGDSSKTFDRAFGLDAEQFDPLFDAWLEGRGAPRRRIR